MIYKGRHKKLLYRGKGNNGKFICVSKIYRGQKLVYQREQLDFRLLPDEINIESDSTNSRFLLDGNTSWNVSIK